MKTGWDLLLKGDYSSAYQLFTAEMIEKPNMESVLLSNRGHTLILLKRPDEALLDFKRLISINPTSANGYICAGIAHVWLNDYGTAAEIWQTGFKSVYTDAAGGILPPAFVYYAGVMLSDTKIIRKAVARLKTRWKPRIYNIWPGAISGFLLGEISEEELFYQAEHLNPTLQLKRTTQSNFWVALRSYEQQNYLKSEKYLELTGKGYKGESEYLLATHELMTRHTKNDL